MIPGAAELETAVLGTAVLGTAVLDTGVLDTEAPVRVIGSDSNQLVVQIPETLALKVAAAFAQKKRLL